jgi:hypothetical protein
MMLRRRHKPKQEVKPVEEKRQSKARGQKGQTPKKKQKEK